MSNKVDQLWMGRGDRCPDPPQLFLYMYKAIITRGIRTKTELATDSSSQLMIFYKQLIR